MTFPAIQNQNTPPHNPSGILAINKHAGVTSHDIVSAVRRLYGTRAVGHTGTLDPMASGVLVMMLGSATGALEYLPPKPKRYRAGLRLGVTTDTEDITGTVTSGSIDFFSSGSAGSGAVLPSLSEVEAVCARFLDVTEQVPPMYSALKIGGKKLVDLARNGITVERKPRPIEIFSLNAEHNSGAGENHGAGESQSAESGAHYILDVRCSGGTYIRTLCADIGAALGCGGVMASLVRTENAGFSLCDSVTIGGLTEMSMEERLARLIPAEELFAGFPVIELPAFYLRLARNGAEIYLHKINTDYPAGQRVRMYGEEKFFALGEVRDFPAGSAIKPLKFFI